MKDDLDQFELEFENMAPLAGCLTGLQSAGAYIWRPDREPATLKADIALVLHYSSHESHFLLSLEQLSNHLAKQAKRSLFEIEVSGDVAGQRFRRFV